MAIRLFPFGIAGVISGLTGSAILLADTASAHLLRRLLRLSIHPFNRLRPSGHRVLGPVKGMTPLEMSSQSISRNVENRFLRRTVIRKCPCERTVECNEMRMGGGEIGILDRLVSR